MISGKRGLAVLLGLWFLFVILASIFGVFAREILHAPIPLGLAAAFPIGAFGGWYAMSRSFRRAILSLDLRVLTLLHTWRVSGIIFIILYVLRILPGVFAVTAGLGDMAMGITAPMVAARMKPEMRLPMRIFVLWNVLGILDMVVAVTLGILSSPGPLGLVGEISSRYMSRFPLSMVPGFLVPFFLILHLIALIRVRSTVHRGMSVGARASRNHDVRF